MNAEILNSRLADAETMRRAIAELPVEFREIVILREMEGFSYKEIADLAEVPIGTVMSRLTRARAIAKTPRRRIQSRKPAMNCQQARPLIDAHADGELEAAGVPRWSSIFRTARVRAAAQCAKFEKGAEAGGAFFHRPGGITATLAG